MNEDGALDRAVLVELEEMVGRDGIRELIDLFADNSADRVQSALRAAASGDLKKAAQALHSLRSSAGMIGAHELERLCAQLEQALAADGDPALGSLLAELEPTQARAVKSLQRFPD